MSQLPNNTPCPHCGRRNHRAITVDALIIHDNNILLIKRKNEPFKDNWALPGGYIDWDESAEDAVKRETNEETGLTATKALFFNVYSNSSRDPKQNITLVYKVETTGKPKAGDDATEYDWFGLKNLPELGFDHKKIIEDYLKIR